MLEITFILHCVFIEGFENESDNMSKGHTTWAK